MPTKTVLLALLAIASVVLVFVLAGDSEDQAIVDQLARKQAMNAPAVSLEPTDESLQPKAFDLTKQLKARRDVDDGRWFVEQNSGSAFVRLPFVPTLDGSLPKSNLAPSHAGDESATKNSNPGFVGSKVCRDCHQQNHDGFVQTAHHKTSGVVDRSNVHGSFSQPNNLMQTSDKNFHFTMRERSGGYFQQINFADWDLEIPLDVFTGSAKAGQTFLYWHGDALFQSHVSYLSELDRWIPSPGYRDITADYARVIRTECLECHVTFIQQKRTPNVYHRDSAVWGVSCERCHGPAQQHVQFHQTHPEEKSSKHIVHPKDLQRDRQLDICGQCHSGAFGFLKDAFSYRPGEDLSDYHRPLNPDFEGVGGIHTSNQLTRLRMSKCFEQSDMTCTTCHNPHENQRGQTSTFTKSCLECHQSEHCGMSEELGAKINDDCIACHMPMGESSGMTLQLSGGSFSIRMIDHHIRIDREATRMHLEE